MWLEGDFFFDCSGFQLLLLGKILGVFWELYVELLFCDCVVVMFWVYIDVNVLMCFYMIVMVKVVGWIWEIDLQLCIGVGYVYLLVDCSDDEVLVMFKCQMIGCQVLVDLCLLKMCVGSYQWSWEGNCMVLGLVGGFIELLELMVIYLIEYVLQFFIDYLFVFGGLECCCGCVNQLMVEMYEELCDFVLLYYVLFQWCDSCFWQCIIEEVVLLFLFVVMLQFWEVKMFLLSDMCYCVLLFGLYNWLFVMVGLYWLLENGIGQIFYVLVVSSVVVMKYVQQLCQQVLQYLFSLWDYVCKQCVVYVG